MFARANKEYEASAPPQRNGLAKQLFPSSSPSANSDIREQFKKPGFADPAASSARTGNSDRSSSAWNRPGARGSTQRSLAALYGNSDSFRHDSGEIIDLTGSGPSEKSKQEVFFAEDDFSDDENLDLDFEAPTSLPPMPKKMESEVKENMPPPSIPSQNLDWSSSSPSHWHPPKLQRTESGVSGTTESSLKRHSSGENDSFDAPAPKKRVLPWIRGQEEQEDPQPVAKTPAHNSRKEYWDPTPSAVKEQKRQLKNGRQPQKPESAVEIKEGGGQAPENVPTKVPFSLSKEQRHVIDLVVNQNKSVFFTGPAGTGKSVLMRAIIEELKKKYSRDPERVAVTASTGLAACNIGGITLHSFSGTFDFVIAGSSSVLTTRTGIGLGKEDASALVKKVRRNPKAKNRWLRVKCLIIDEVSMVDGDLFDKLSHIGRVIRNNGRPWGGMQLIITGDFFQLPPVPESGKRDVKFAFDASTWSTSIDHTIGLTEVFRQRDPEFARMLNEMRLGQISAETERAFKALSRPLKFDDGVDMAQLYPTRAQVDSSNASRLRALPGQPMRFESLDSGDPVIRDKLLSNMMAPKSLDLKVGAQVMLIKNWDESLVNGSLGKVIAFSDERGFEMKTGSDYDAGMEDAMAKARRKLKEFSADSDGEGQKYPVVQFIATNGTARTVLCQPEEWQVELPNGEVQAKRSQLPLILAWALSIHKAQGQTLERVTVDLGRVFEKGQAYVALSRATSQHGLQVLHFNKSKVMAHPRVCTFYQQLYTAEVAHQGRPTTLSDFIADRKGAKVSRTKATEVVDLVPDEEAMASMGY